MYSSIEPSLLLSLSGSVNCTMIILHLQVTTYQVCLSGSGIPHTEHFFPSSIQFACRFHDLMVLKLSCNCSTFSVEGHLGFQFLAIMNKAAMNIVEQMYWWYSGPSDYMLRSGIAGS